MTRIHTWRKNTQIEHILFTFSIVQDTTNTCSGQASTAGLDGEIRLSMLKGLILLLRGTAGLWREMAPYTQHRGSLEALGLQQLD